MNTFFKLKENKTGIKTEIIAGVTTFFTMAYIIFVNPETLSVTGMDSSAVMIATCLSAAIGTFLIGFLSNYPFAQAPGMGINAFFAFTICGVMGYSWQAALAAVFFSGLIFILITLTGLRRIIVEAIPISLKRAFSAGIGLFIALIGLANIGFIATPTGGSPIIGLGDLSNPSVLLSLFSLILIIALLCLKVKAGLFIAVFTTSVIAILLQFTFGIGMGISAPDFSSGFADSFSAFAAAFGQCFTGFSELFNTSNGIGAMLAGLLSVLIALTLTDMFDTIGMLVGTAEKAGFLDKNGNLPRADRALLADAVATSVGAILGTSTVTTYAESNAGISIGGRTGLTSVVTASLFLLSLLLAPFLRLVPSAATAPVLVIVGIMMLSSLKNIHWDDITEAIPCFFTAVMMPFTYSISDGIGLGFISFSLVKLFTGKIRELHPVLAAFSVIFVFRYILMAVGII